jgi:hemolysin activation/secretion protein
MFRLKKINLLFYLLIIQIISFSSLLAEEECPELKKLVLYDNEKNLVEHFHYGVNIADVKVPGDVDKFIKRLKPFIGLDITQNNITKIKEKIIKYYSEYKRLFVFVNIPEQNISEGMLKVQVIESALNDVRVSGNKWSSTNSIINNIRLKNGTPIISDILEEDLYWLNRNPFRQSYAVYTPGAKNKTTDIEILVDDRFPARPYIGVDNIGNDATGNNRIFAGIMLGNLFKTDQTLSYQYTPSPDFKRFQGHSLIYTAPLPWRHILVLIGGYSYVDSKYTVDTYEFHSSGFSLQTSLRYTVPLMPKKSVLQEVIYGFDFKRTNSNLEYGGTPAIDPKLVNLTQAMVGYNLGFSTKKTKTSFEIEGFLSPGQIVSDQSNADYNSMRPFAKADYFYARTSLSVTWQFSKYLAWKHFLRGQAAIRNLLPSEEYGLGGFDTVRGYKERQDNFDNVAIYNTEIYLPSFSLLKFAGYKKPIDKFNFLVFLDLAIGSKHKISQGEQKEKMFAGIGSGIRYNIANYLNCRLDFGKQLIKRGTPHHRWSFSVISGF